MSENQRQPAAVTRAQHLLRLLAAEQSDSEQLRIITAQRSSYAPLFGFTGGAFDLAIAADDTGFRLPGKDREATEKIIAAATRQASKDLIEATKERSRRLMRLAGRIAGIAAAACAAIFAIVYVLHSLQSLPAL